MGERLLFGTGRGGFAGLMADGPWSVVGSNIGNPSISQP